MKVCEKIILIIVKFQNFFNELASNNNKKRGRNESIYNNFHINEKKIITLKKKDGNYNEKEQKEEILFLIK